jgi:hypothetical protein
MIAGTTYRVLWLDGATRGPRFLLRSDHGDLFGLYSYGAEPMKLYAVPLIALCARSQLGQLHQTPDDTVGIEIAPRKLRRRGSVARVVSLDPVNGGGRGGDVGKHQ